MEKANTERLLPGLWLTCWLVLRPQGPAAARGDPAGTQQEEPGRRAGNRSATDEPNPPHQSLSGGETGKTREEEEESEDVRLQENSSSACVFITLVDLCPPSPGCVCMSACVSCWWDSSPSISPSIPPSSEERPRSQTCAEGFPALVFFFFLCFL